MSKSGGHYTSASPTPNSGGDVSPPRPPKVYASAHKGGVLVSWTILVVVAVAAAAAVDL